MSVRMLRTIWKTSRFSPPFLLIQTGPDISNFQETNYHAGTRLESRYLQHKTPTFDAYTILSQRYKVTKNGGGLIKRRGYKCKSRKGSSFEFQPPQTEQKKIEVQVTEISRRGEAEV